jgi:hypothetical protein
MNSGLRLGSRSYDASPRSTQEEGREKTRIVVHTATSAALALPVSIRSRASPPTATIPANRSNVESAGRTVGSAKGSVRGTQGKEKTGLAARSRPNFVAPKAKKTETEVIRQGRHSSKAAVACAGHHVHLGRRRPGRPGYARLFQRQLPPKPLRPMQASSMRRHASSSLLMSRSGALGLWRLCCPLFRRRRRRLIRRRHLSESYEGAGVWR